MKHFLHRLLQLIIFTLFAHYTIAQTSPVQNIFPKGTIRLCHYITSGEESFDGIFYTLTVDGRLIRSQFSVTRSILK